MKGFNKEIVGFRKLARSWKSDSAGQGSQNDDSTDGFHKQRLCFRRLARSWKSDSGDQAQGSQNDDSMKDLMRKL